MEKTRPNGHECFHCGKPASYGYRRSGLLSALNNKSYLWACAEHRGEAEARKARAEG